MHHYTSPNFYSYFVCAMCNLCMCVYKQVGGAVLCVSIWSPENIRYLPSIALHLTVLCICVYCMHMYVYSMYTARCLIAYFIILTPFRQGLSLSLELSCWPASLRILLLGLQVQLDCPFPDLFVGAGDLNSGLRAYAILLCSEHPHIGF